MSFTNLFSEAIRERIEEPKARFSSESMPGIDGQFVQCFGSGAREIVVDGLLTATGLTSQLAVRELKLSIRQRQELVSGRSPGEYHGTDSVTYSGCILKRYYPTADIQTETLAAGAFRAFVSVRAEIIQFAP